MDRYQTGTPVQANRREPGPLDRYPGPDRSRTGPDGGTSAARRGAVYRLLVDGRTSARAAAGVLKLARGTMQRTVDFLLARGHLQFIGGAKAPPRSVQLFQAGPVPWTGLDRGTGGGSGLPAVLTARVHNGRVKVRIVQAPADLLAVPGVERPWRTSGVMHVQYVQRKDDGVWRFQASRGPRGGPNWLQVFSPVVHTNDLNAIATSEVWWKDRAQKAAHEWAKTSGFVLERVREEAVLTGPVEHGFGPVAAAPSGDPVRDQVHIDRSGTLGNEVEFKGGAKAAEFASMPGQVRGLHAEMQEVHQVMAGLDGRIADQGQSLRVIEQALAHVAKTSGNLVQMMMGPVPSNVVSAPIPTEGFA